MKTLSLLVCLLGLTANVFAQVDYQLRSKTIMELAVQHFNKDHSKELTTQSDEFKFMSALMSQLGEKFPAQKNANIREIITKSFTSVDFEVFVPKKGAQPEDQVFFQEITDLTSGCGLEEITTVNKADFSLVKAPRVTTTVEKKFRLSEKNPYNENAKVCRNSLVKKLLKLGATEIKTVNRTSDYGIQKRVEVVYGYGMQDMGFKLGELKLDPDFTFLSERLTNNAKPIMGGGNTLGLKDSSGKATFADPVTIVFVRGWGDCPAGCINHEFTTIQATPKSSTSFDFDFKVIPTPVLK